MLISEIKANSVLFTNTHERGFHNEA